MAEDLQKENGEELQNCIRAPLPQKWYHAVVGYQISTRLLTHQLLIVLSAS